jgi:ubiquinone/menaquinone biosynthesis C-methylase UbiE
MKLNLGCGSQYTDGWINVDYSLGARITKIPFFRTLNRQLNLFDLDWNEKIYLHNLTQKFPWSDLSANVIYSSHTLEHFSKQDGRNFLAECHRVLCKNGIIRIVVPDLQHQVNEYISGRIDADDFVEELGVLCGNTSSALKHRLAPLFQFPHKCMYDRTRLLAILNEIGFETATRSTFDSDIEAIELVELAGRTENALIVEGRKR